MPARLASPTAARSDLDDLGTRRPRRRSGRVDARVGDHHDGRLHLGAPRCERRARDVDARDARPDGRRLVARRHDDQQPRDGRHAGTSTSSRNAASRCSTTPAEPADAGCERVHLLGRAPHVGALASPVARARAARRGLGPAPRSPRSSSVGDVGAELAQHDEIHVGRRQPVRRRPVLDPCVRRVPERAPGLDERRQRGVDAERCLASRRERRGERRRAAADLDREAIALVGQRCEHECALASLVPGRAGRPRVALRGVALVERRRLRRAARARRHSSPAKRSSIAGASTTRSAGCGESGST